MAQTVVVVSSQLITTLSALAYLRTCNITGTDLRVLSLERLDQVHAAHAFEEELIHLAARDGHCCVFGELSALPTEPEGLICDLLLLPRVDHKQGRAVLQRCLPDVVIELGESIGVEPKLYSFRARRLRHRSIHHLLESRPNLRLDYSYLVPLDREVNKSRLQHFLGCCSDFSVMIGKNLTALKPAINFINGDVLLCLPYLKVKKWHFRVELFGRVKGIKCSQRFYDWKYFLTRVQSYVNGLRVNGEVSPRLYVQAHPKNHQDLKLIEQQLIRGLKGTCNVELKVLPCDAPLELILSDLIRTSLSPSIHIAGFGTNILSAAAFLHSYPHSINLCDKKAEGRIQRLWNFCFDGLVYRREFLRQRHVRKVFNNLLKATR
jgi:hypothetical protein